MSYDYKGVCAFICMVSNDLYNITWLIPIVQSIPFMRQPHYLLSHKIAAVENILRSY